MCTHCKVLVIGPGPNVRGGITSVIQTYQRTSLWNTYNCKWLSTYDDRSHVTKLAAFIRAFILAPFLVVRYNIIHIHVAQNTSFYRKTIFFLLAKLFGKKTIVHLHAPYPQDFQRRPLRTVSNFVLAHSNAVVALSEIWASEIKNIAPGAAIRIIYNPCEIPEKVGVPWETKSPVILFLGKLEKRKGYHDLICAMPAILENVPDAKLMLAGHGEIDDATRLAGDLGIAEHVICTGWVAGHEKEQLLSNAKVFCLPSFGEGVPISMLDAMAHKIPIVVTPVGGIPDLIKDRQNGYFVEPGNHRDISSAVLAVLCNSEQSEKMLMNAFNTVQQMSGVDNVSKRLTEIYEELNKK